MKAPTDKNGKLLVVGGFYTGYNRGIYQLIDFEIRKHENISIVKKVMSGRGVAILNPRPTSMGNGWLQAVAAPTIVFDDPTGYWQEKRERIKCNDQMWGKKLVECGACAGVGMYDNMVRGRNGKMYQPECGACDGTGKVREK